jgi:hypothetical protein
VSAITTVEESDGSDMGYSKRPALFTPALFSRHSTPDVGDIRVDTT